MSRRSWWWALVLGVGLAAAGAGIAYVLAGGPWAAAGAVIGAVAGAFAPSVYDGVRERGVTREAWRGSLESPPAQSWARLLDPRRELAGFVGRKEERPFYSDKHRRHGMNLQRSDFLTFKLCAKAA